MLWHHVTPRELGPCRVADGPANLRAFAQALVWSVGLLLCHCFEYSCLSTRLCPRHPLQLSQSPLRSLPGGPDLFQSILCSPTPRSLFCTCCVLHLLMFLPFLGGWTVFCFSAGAYNTGTQGGSGGLADHGTSVPGCLVVRAVDPSQIFSKLAALVMTPPCLPLYFPICPPVKSPRVGGS